MIERLRLLKNSFPKSWIRKLPLLLFPTDTVKKNERVIAMCTTFRRRIILLCVDERFRRKGIASKLIQKSNAVKTDTYLYNDKALKVWEKNGFKVHEIVNTPFGKKYILIRGRTSPS